METIDDERLIEPSVYIHVPFCKSKCPYCDFNSIPINTSEQISEIEDAYRDAVVRELKHVSADKDLIFDREPPTSVYFGGGTPSLLSPAFFEAVLSSIEDELGALSKTEITIEANPDSIDMYRLKDYRASGINRISIGIQSLNDRDLLLLQRPHTAKEALSAFEAARRAGFENISIDLIFALPGQSLKDWQKVLKDAASLKAEHLSIYGLTIEEGTPFMVSKERGDIRPAPEALEIEMYEAAVETLKEAGYSRYEISNFSLPKRESLHNSGYWTGRDYIGLGAGAHSYLGRPGFGRRYWNLTDPAEYMVSTDAEHVAGEEMLSEVEAMTEALMLGLRLTKGIDVEAFKERFGSMLMETQGYKKLLEFKLLEEVEGHLRLTDKGILLSNEVFTAISS